jgi:hypothetical protein
LTIGGKVEEIIGGKVEVINCAKPNWWGGNILLFEKRLQKRLKG